MRKLKIAQKDENKKVGKKIPVMGNYRGNTEKRSAKKFRGKKT